MHSLIIHSEVIIVKVPSEPSVLTGMHQHTLKMIYHLEGALKVIALKYTHYVTSYVWMKSVL